MAQSNRKKFMLYTRRESIRIHREEITPNQVYHKPIDFEEPWKMRSPTWGSKINKDQGWEVFTDGSRMEERTACAFVILNDGIIVEEEVKRSTG